MESITYLPSHWEEDALKFNAENDFVLVEENEYMQELSGEIGNGLVGN